VPLFGHSLHGDAAEEGAEEDADLSDEFSADDFVLVSDVLTDLFSLLLLSVE